jgi:hypothetical protein
MIETMSEKITPRAGQLPPDQTLLTQLAVQLLATGHGGYTPESACEVALNTWTAAGNALASLPVASQTAKPTC